MDSGHHPLSGSGEPHPGQPSDAGSPGAQEGEGRRGVVSRVRAARDAERAGAHEHLGQQRPPHGDAEAAPQTGVHSDGSAQHGGPQGHR